MLRVYPVHAACPEPRREPRSKPRRANPTRSLHPEERRVYPACTQPSRSARTRSVRPNFTAKSTPILSSSDLCALCVSGFSSPNVDAADAASSVSPLSATLTKNTRGWVSVPIANPIFQFNRRFIPNPHRITFFAHPHPLTPIESYSCKKQGRGYPPVGQTFSLSSLTSSIPILSLLRYLITPSRPLPQAEACTFTPSPAREATPIPSWVYIATRGNPGGGSPIFKRRRFNFLATSTEHGTRVAEHGSRDTGRGTRVTASHSLPNPLKPPLQMAHPYTCTRKKGPAAREPRYSPCAAS